MENELDLSHSKWNSDDDIYMQAIKDGIKENYPDINLDEELKDAGYTIQDLLNPGKIALFMMALAEKYPD